METKSPFSVYDFLGYFIPGALFLYSLAYLKSHCPFLVRARDFFLPGGDALKELSIFVPFVLWAYLIGHVLNLVSSYTVEKYSIWAHGYPSKYLVSQKIPPYFDGADKNPARLIFKCAVPVFLLPMTFWELLIGKVFKARELYSKKLDHWLCCLLIAHITDFMAKHLKEKEAIEFNKKLLQEDKVKTELKFSPKEHDFFRVIEPVVIELSATRRQMALNYVGLYGFLRAACLLSVIWFWIPIIQHLGVSWYWHNEGTLCAAISELPYRFLLVCSMLSFVLFVGFVKFFRRFNLTILLGIIALKDADASKNAGAAH